MVDLVRYLPGTPEYTHLADERARKLRQLNDQYEAASKEQA